VSSLVLDLLIAESETSEVYYSTCIPACPDLVLHSES
jgi:hypothetical protein